ncbi:MAG: leucine-rich repeat protein [Muribaculaceae bacterium]
MKKTIPSMLLSLACLSSWASSVTSTPGQLSGLVTDHSVQELTVTGTLDVRDFAFIANELQYLFSLDLSNAAIEAYSPSAGECFFGSRDASAANVLPPYSFFASSISHIALPAQLAEIGEVAFAACANLSAISIPESVSRIGANAFNASALSQVAVNARVIADGAFADCAGLTSVQLGTNVASIGNRAFAGCANLATIDLADGSMLQTIGEEAFMGTAISSFDFTLCPNVESVGKWAFAGTKMLKAELPESLSEVPEGVFFGNSDTEQITIPEFAESIGDYAYYRNTTSNNVLKIPANVTAIGNNAFEGVAPASVIAYPLDVPALGKEVFKGMNDASRIVLYVEKDAIASYRSAAQWNDFDIQDIAATEAPMIGADNAIKAWFDGMVLCITASIEIQSVNIYNEAGMLCGTSRGTGCDVRINTSAIASGAVIAAVTLKGGEVRIFKLLRN